MVTTLFRKVATSICTVEQLHRLNLGRLKLEQPQLGYEAPCGRIFLLRGLIRPVKGLVKHMNRCPFHTRVATLDPVDA